MEKDIPLKDGPRLLTGNKHLDSIILNKLTDSELFKISLTGRYGNYLCNYEPFWYARIGNRFPFFLNLKSKELNSKKYYIYLVRAISDILKKLRIKGNPGKLEKEEKGVDQNTLEALTLENKNEALEWSSFFGYLEIIKFLIQKGANVNADDDQPLKEAIEGGRLEVVKYLVENGANIHTGGDVPLLMASERGRLEIVKYLVENGADINGSVALRYASNFLEVIKCLVQNGADIHANDDEALRTAIEYGQLEVIKYLVQNGANIHANNDQPLNTYIRGRREETEKYLKELIDWENINKNVKKH